MAKLIGVVSKIVGEVFAVASDGTRRALAEGDRLFVGEQLDTGVAGAVAVHLQNGSELTLGRGSSLQLSDALLANRAPHVDTPEASTPSQAQLTDVEKLQQAIASGVDPSQEADPTAAGPGSGGASGAAGGGHSFVLLSEVAGRVDPVIGFPTAGFNGFPELADLDVGLFNNNEAPPVLVAPPEPAADNPVSLEGLAVDGGELSLNEANLAQGSASNPAALTQAGSFTVVAPDGVFNLNVGGINVVTAGAVTGVGQSITTGLGNVLTITGYDAATGVVSYSYTLTGAEAHAAGNGANGLGESFTVLVSDTDGDVASGSLDVTVIDDVPRAEGDTNSVTATENQLTLTGNVLTNDVQGADRIATGPITPGTFTGKYGTLVLAADGTYTYTLNTADPDFINLHGGGTGVETFTYTLNDADGDTSTANLVLNVSNLNDSVTLNGLNVNGGELTVFEKNLGDGSAPNASALTQSGSFTISAPDGVQSMTVHGVSVITGGVASTFPQVINTPLGNTLTITGFDPATGVVSYSYTLGDNEAHATGAGANSLGESFQVVVTDTDGSTASGNIDVNIVDDMPTANPDSNDLIASETRLTLSGNVLTNDVQGADRVTAGPITPGTFTGKYGTLVLAADGTYTYTLNTTDPDFINLHGGGTGVETFTYTLNDADGDTSTANLVLNVSNLNDPVTLNGLNVNGGELTVFEKNLGDGSAPNTSALTKTGSFTITAPDGVQSMTVHGVSVITGGVANTFPQVINTPLGNTLTITGFDPATGVVTYSYTLGDNETHATGAGANSLGESFQVVVTDTDGSTASGNIDVNIVDDVPTANPDSNDLIASETRLTLSGNVLTNDVQGADRVTAGPITPGTFTGKYGTLVLNADGTYTYTLNTSDADFINLHGGGTGVETFTYTLTDADGDVSSANLELKVSNLDNPVVINGLDITGGEQTVFEKNLSDGSSPDASALTKTGTFTVTAPDGLQSLIVGGITVVSGGVVSGFPQTGTTPLGNSLTITGYNPSTGVVSYTYTLLDNESHPNAGGINNLSDSITVTATDSDGSSATAHLDVTIVDDVPGVVGAERSVTPGQVDSNLLLIIDVSSSMTSGSGVNGLSRLELSKQAINALLDKYDEMGDVKVQIVIFGSDASAPSTVWLSVADAKLYVAGLHAGGTTNYDAAVAAAQQAFVTNGKIDGAQNVGYFFSDGAPVPSSSGLNAQEEAAWKAFLDQNGIKTYAIGLGNGVNTDNLNPLAYDGSTHTDTNSVVVTDLSMLNQVLSGTVQGAPITGSLMTDGHFGADGGFIKSLLIDGTTYTYDPKANNGQGSYTATGTDRGSFDTTTNSFNIKTVLGGTFVVDMDTGEFTYTPPKDNGTTRVETIGFTASDNDGDVSSATLTVNVHGNTAPVVGADHIITNILSSTIVVPAEALLANDSDADNDRLSTGPTSFNTGWEAKGAGFTVTNASLQQIDFDGTGSSSGNREKALDRSAFRGAANVTTAALIVNGYLGAVSTTSANDEDVLTVTLKKGEKLTLNHDVADGHILMQWKDATGSYENIVNGDSFTASHDGVYSIHVVNLTNTSGSSANAAEYYNLTMTVDYAGAQPETYNGTYAVSDGHGGSVTGNVDITYHAGSTLTGTDGSDTLLAGAGNDTLTAGAGNDVLIGGDGDDTLQGGDGNDLLIGGAGNDVLDGGAGIDTASYAGAGSGVTVSLNANGSQNTLGAGTDTLTGIENLVGSDYNDTLTGNDMANLLRGGLGNDTLVGGGGDDVLIGGRGNNTLTGGAGSDTFQWQQGNSGHDVVTDFTPGSDRLDLSQLLQGENATSTSLDDYLHFKVTGSGAGVVSTIEVSAVAGAAPVQTIDLAGVNLAQHYGVTAGAGGVIAAGQDTATIINGMLNDHSLKVDTV
ncbi:retention module-containing protein [Pseudomonas sp. JQ170]|uniref:retention module-containing protein n=1 Tax=unclassified Pseudomonas TaxID=196821 RepID=UPI00264D6331|nr:MULTISPECIES: retention module-containing protein [unclassified Pseudomonas]MDN7139241.1 retention module-containing protein [Pseudomonas sp. JQ170]WRO77439.1 retention module-containing protein [Pseudomonas sp. 170C]